MKQWLRNKAESAHIYYEIVITLFDNHFIQYSKSYLACTLPRHWIYEFIVLNFIVMTMQCNSYRIKFLIILVLYLSCVVCNQSVFSYLQPKQPYDQYLIHLRLFIYIIFTNKFRTNRITCFLLYSKISHTFYKSISKNLYMFFLNQFLIDIVLLLFKLTKIYSIEFK